ncbi:UNVERIFIED_CONTAM: hypothetical protein HDU68_006666 [Siphonaria sp. JEL0065]|nr:hypothetical protein HDU68_006666 [Siphonaria sp. JEL0065]
MASARITVDDLLAILEATSPNIPALDPTVTGLTGFLQMYTETRMQIVHSVVARWNQSIDLFASGSNADLDQNAEHAQAIAKIHKEHMHFLLKTLTLFEYKAILINRFQASLIARVNQHGPGGSFLQRRTIKQKRHPSLRTLLQPATEQSVSRIERNRLRTVTGLKPVRIVWFTKRSSNR